MKKSLDLGDFLAWFTSRGGSLSPSMSLTEFPESEGGRGAVAISDIPYFWEAKENTTLFTIPRELTLSTRTSSLPKVFGTKAWKEAGLDKGWVGLILCLLWEASRETGSPGNWIPYLESLPSKFDTPMFWTDDELKELEGTAVLDKIGKTEAEKDYHETLAPIVQSRPDLFPPSKHAKNYSLEAYHLMGSRILSRSFHVEKWENGDSVPQENETEDVSINNTQPLTDHSMEVDEPESSDHGSEEEDGDEEDSSDVAMVPMADLLNARCNAGNAKLFYEERVLKMLSTRPISAGEQIWNTYGDPPNSDLLRRYGHVDELILPEELGSGIGNPKDVVEIRADIVVEQIVQKLQSDEDDLSERIDYWLDQGGDDVFLLDYESVSKLPKDLTALIHLLIHPQDQWISAFRDKAKLPKPKLTTAVCEVWQAVLISKINEYPFTFMEDSKSFDEGGLTGRKRKAVIVRMGELRILGKCLENIEGVLRNDAGPTMQESRSIKRERDDFQDGRKGKKRRQ